MKWEGKKKQKIAVIGVIILLALGFVFHVNNWQSDNSIIRLLSISEVKAEEKETKSYDEKNGIAQIKLVYIDSSGQEHLLKTGCGFFFGDAQTGTYCLTNNRIVTLTEEEKLSYIEQFAIESGEIPTTIKIVLKRDITVTATIENGSQSMDFVILKPDDSLKGTVNLRLSEATNTFQTNQEVYSLGFQDITDTNLEAIKTEGVVEDWITNNDIHYYKHTIPVTGNNIGAPLLNKQGEVIGINITGINETGNYAVQISEVIEVLQTLGITYNSELEIDTSGLLEAIQQYETLKQEDYTSESWDACSAVYEQAMDLLTQIEEGYTDNYTEQNMLSTEQDLYAAMKQLEPLKLTVKKVLIIAAIIFCVLIGVISALIVILIKKRIAYSKKLSEEQQKKMTAEELLKATGRITPGELQNTDTAYFPENRSLSQVQEERRRQTSIVETTVLSEELDPHILCGNQKNGNPVLIRKRTGEKILIEKNSFVIGKSREQTDYCIANNPNISRIHICIKKNEDGYYIQDLKTTNGTYVDGQKVNWDRDIKLVNGCVIRLADEEFEFSC